MNWLKKVHKSFAVRALLVLMTACGAAPALEAQTDAQYTQFYEIPSIYNPSAIGRTDFIRIRGAGRLQWIGIDGAPKSFLGAVDMPFKLATQRFGVGIVAQQESIGLYSSLNLGAQIAWKLRKLGGEFTFGMQIGMYDERFKGSEVYIPDGDDYHQSGDDAIPTTDVHGTALDLGAGIWYARKTWHVGVSCTHLTSPAIKMGGDNGGSGTDENIFEFNVNRTLYLIGGCNIPIKNTLFEVMPSVLAKTDFTFFSAEAMARVRYNKFLSFGIGYRWNDAVTATIAAEIKNFFIGYSFDYSTSSLHSASAGSHEIVAGYSLKLDLGEKNKNKHRSIRIM